ncbi:hypothetical protein Tco_0742934 [Tanacetum coccineum]
MERGFLSSNTKDKDKDDGGGEQSPVARLVKQDKEGKMLGRDGVNVTPVVLDRIETETMTKEDNATPFPTSYSNILKVVGNAGKGNASSLGPDSSKTVRFRQLVNRTIVENSNCVLTKNVAAVVKCKYDNTLVGYFLGKNIAFPLVKNHVNNTWSKFGLTDLMKIDDGFCQRPTAKGVGLRVADSHTGNHPEDGFTPPRRWFYTTRNYSEVIGCNWEKIPFGLRRGGLQAGEDGKNFKSYFLVMSVKDTIVVQHCGLSAKELNEFLSFYPIPSEYDVILPKSTETIFDAPPGYVGLLNPFGCAKLTTFIIMCKAYGCEPSVDLFREIAFRNFIYTENDDDLVFLPNEPSLGFEVTADSGESLKASVFVVHPGSVAARIKERKCKTRGGSSRPPVKRKLASGSSSSRAVRAKNSASKDDDPILSISDDDEGKFLVHLVLYEVIDLLIHPLSLLSLHQLGKVIKKMRGEANVIKASERSHEEECEELRVKCEAAMAEFDQNSTIRVLREKISSLTTNVKEHKGNLDKMMLESQKWSGYQVTLLTLESKVDSLEAEKARLEAVEASLRREAEELKQDRKDVVSKVVPYAALEAYEQITAMKEPFDLSKAKGYRSSYKKEHTQDNNDFATTTFPWLDEFVADVATSIEALLSKKPPTL